MSALNFPIFPERKTKSLSFCDCGLTGGCHKCRPSGPFYYEVRNFNIDEDEDEGVYFKRVKCSTCGESYFVVKKD